MALKSRYSPLTKPSFENIYHAFTGLNPRDQLIAMIVGAVVLVIVVILPLSVVSGKVSSLKTGISKSQAKLNDVLNKVEEYKAVQTEIRTLEKKYGRGVSSMTSTIETMARNVGLAGAIQGLKEKPQIPGDQFVELPVELKLKNTTLKALVELMYKIETYPNALLRIKNLYIKPRFSNRAFLEVTMDIANIKLKAEG